jgi:hypothetical protein
MQFTSKPDYRFHVKTAYQQKIVIEKSPEPAIQREQNPLIAMAVCKNSLLATRTNSLLVNHKNGFTFYRF